MACRVRVRGRLSCCVPLLWIVLALFVEFEYMLFSLLVACCPTEGKPYLTCCPTEGKPYLACCPTEGKPYLACAHAVESCTCSASGPSSRVVMTSVALPHGGERCHVASKRRGSFFFPLAAFRPLILYTSCLNLRHLPLLLALLSAFSSAPSAAWFSLAVTPWPPTWVWMLRTLGLWILGPLCCACFLFRLFRPLNVSSRITSGILHWPGT